MVTQLSAAALVAALALSDQLAIERLGALFASDGTAPATTVATVPAPRGDLVLDALLTFRPTADRSPRAVQVDLEPKDGGFTVLQARALAEEGFLAALNEPALGDLTRVVVTVKLVKGTSDRRLQRTMVWRKKGEGNWSLMAG